MSQGYAFVWKPGESLYMIRPDGFVIRFEVVMNVPVLRLGSELSRPVPLRRKDLVIEWGSELATPVVEGDPELLGQQEPSHSADSQRIEEGEEPSEDHPDPEVPHEPAD